MAYEQDLAVRAAEDVGRALERRKGGAPLVRARAYGDALRSGAIDGLDDRLGEGRAEVRGRRAYRDSKG